MKNNEIKLLLEEITEKISLKKLIFLFRGLKTYIYKQKTININTFIMSDKKEKKSIKQKMEEEYQKVDPVAHILLRPDTYIGSIEQDTRPMWIYNSEEKLIKLTDLSFVPGFIKIFDEIIVNARDHQIKDKTCKTIRVNINKSDGIISVYNDGNGIPIVKISVELEKGKPKVDMYVPELIFGHLLSGSNFNDQERDDTVGGRNGYGSKLTNCFSKRFIVETVYIDKKEKIYKKFIQEYTNNMSMKTNPIITDVPENTTPYTKITYQPDFERFKMKGFTNDIIGLLNKRVYDISACTAEKVSVYLNDEKIKIKNFDDFISLHYEKKPKIVYKEVNERWKVGVVFDPDNGGNHVSFVNGIFTYAGGTHVEYIANQITKKVSDHIKQKKEHKSLNIKPNQIREHLTFFIESIISGPSFSSQTKETLITKVSNFGSECELSAGFIKEVIDTGLATLVTKLATMKDMAGLKQTDGKKVSGLHTVPKLNDAHNAGTRKSKECRLILTEGDSALAFALSGIKVLGRDRYGAFPLKGKLLNVRNATAAQIKKNQEFIYLKKILGLKQDTKYHDVSKLRYGGIIILTDQDADGSHIKGLIINMFQYFWPELLQIDGFIQTLSTPLIKVFKKSDSKKQNPKVFYTMTEFDTWLENEIKHGDIGKWQKPKYYKGLGTSSEKEAKEIFNDFENRIISYTWEKFDSAGNELAGAQKAGNKDNTDGKKSSPKDNETDSDDSDSDDNNSNSFNELIYNSKSYDKILLAFDASKANDRKVWLNSHNKNNILEYNKQSVPYSEFIDKDLIHFSTMDNVRSIPSLIDSFKPSHRKIFYACLKKNQRSEIKVAQLASYVAEHTAYKHGEKSMEESIVGMAQRFTGANNIYLLHPCGNFGYRRMGGDEHASSRYIFTYLDPIARKIFIEQDDCILKYQEDEGETIEPEYYCPIIPMILVNGSKGVGTGWSTDIPQYNPMDICKNILRKLDGKEMKDIHPWYHGFQGEIIHEGDNKYKITGNFEIVNQTTVRITEIPIKGSLCWSENYEEFLKTLVYDEKNNKKGKIDEIRPDCGNNEINFTVTFRGSELQSMIKRSNDGKEEVEKYLKLQAKLSVSNMWLYNTKNVITHYENPLQIMEEFYDFRLKMYGERKKHHLKILANELEILKNKVRFINDVISGKIVVTKKSKLDVIVKVKSLGYPRLSSKLDAIDPPNDNIDIREDTNDKHDDKHNDDEPDLKKEKGITYKSYKYITDMPLFSLTTEKIDELTKKLNDKQAEFDDYNSTSETEFWRRELKALMDYYPHYLQQRNEEENDDDVEGTDKKKKKKDKKNKKQEVKPVVSKPDDSDSEDERPKKIHKKKSVSSNEKKSKKT